jgi:hypothetical protein
MMYEEEKKQSDEGKIEDEVPGEHLSSQSHIGLRAVEMELVSSQPVTTMGGRYHTRSNFDDYGIYAVRLSRSLYQEIRQEGFLERLRVQMVKEAAVIHNDKPLEQLTEEDLKNAERLAIASGNNLQMFKKAFPLQKDRDVVLKIRSEVKSLIVEHHLVSDIGYPSDTEDAEKIKQYFRKEKARLHVMESVIYSMPNGTFWIFSASSASEGYPMSDTK